MDIRTFIKWRWRTAMKNGIIFFGVLGLLQALFGPAMFLTTGTWAVCHEATPFTLRLIGATLLPFGWVLPLLSIGMLVGYVRYRRDLASPNPMTAHGTITKCPPSTWDCGDPSPYQGVALQGTKRQLMVPLEFWETMPDAMEGECQYLAHSRVVYTINGHNVWDSCQQSPAPDSSPAAGSVSGEA